MPSRTLSPRPPWKGRRVVLGVCGGISAYKSVQLARDLTRLGALVEVVMTSGARRFVQPLSFQAVTGREVHTDLFSGTGPALHIRLGLEADAVVVAPATAGFMARAAQGLAGDLLATTLLVTRAPVVLCPAMNDRMWDHPQTRRNVAHLQEALGYVVAGPGMGPLAVGEGEGPGRMLEPWEILEEVGRKLGRDPLWEDREVLVTAGPTREPLDPVRYLGNRSSGRMGYALAAAAWRRGARVTLVSGPSALEAPRGVERCLVETAQEMRIQVLRVLPRAHVLLFAAAVSDFRPEAPWGSKVKRSRSGEGLEVRLAPNPDIARDSRGNRLPGSVALGFALETEDLLAGARRKLEEKGLDLIAANSPLEEGAGFEVETNRLTVLDRDGGVEALPLLPKEELAEILLDRVAGILRARG